MTITGFIDCQICGDPVPQVKTRAKRLYHPECKKAKNYIDAAVRAGNKIDCLDERTKHKLRGLLYAAAFQFRSPQPRSSDGRFVLTTDDPRD